MIHRTALPLAVAALALAGCSSDADPAEGQDRAPSSSGASSGSAAEDDHGETPGAEEVAEPPLHLMTVDGDGGVGLVDLVDGTEVEVGDVSAPAAATTDGRYLFVTTDDGLEVVDSGMWTWDHGDHFHYYRSAPDLPGTVTGRGAPRVSTGQLSTAGGTGVLFPDSGEAVLLDNGALSDGEVREQWRLDVEPHDGLVAPLGGGAVVTVPDASGSVSSVQRYDDEGQVVAGSEERCADARGTITTAVGLVVGCADGALLWTEQDDEWVAERIAYPRRLDAPRAADFRAREGRPTVAALAGDSGIWLLDTRERTWQLLDAGAPLQQVVAADDEDGHVVALDRAGRVRVYLAESGEQVAATEPLLTGDGPGAPALEGVRLVVDDQRAYLNDPGGARVLEIDYADGARIARELATPTDPDFYAEVGR
ncbi:lipoprotein [Alloalcanivorax gelatiniphagus]